VEACHTKGHKVMDRGALVVGDGMRRRMCE